MNEDVLKLLKERYFLEDETKWEDLAKRISGIYPPSYELIKDMKFIPSSPTLMNANTKGKRKGTLSSCFPMGIKDSIEEIYESLKEVAIVTKYGGGVGLDMSVLRSSNEGIKTLNNRHSSGPLAFLDNFNSVLDTVSQGGVRRGAGACLLSIFHPQIYDYISAKKDYRTGRLKRFNLSVKIPSWFYEKLEKEPNSIMQVMNVTDNTVYNLKDENGKEITVKELWDAIIKQSHSSAEPGIFNSDIAYNQCTVTNVDKNVLMNPCSEFVNIPYSSCCLASFNLSKYIYYRKFDWEEYGKDVEIGIQFENEVIDQNIFPLKKIEEVTKKIRPIGIGVMGLAHALMKMHIPYSSKEAFEFTRQVLNYTTTKGMLVSIKLAKENGKAYPAFDKELFIKANSRFLSNPEDINQDVKIKDILNGLDKYGIYNSSITSVAPTGCVIEETKIITEEGIKTIKEIFKLNGIDINKLTDKKNKWFIPTKELKVLTIDGYKRILKLYINKKSSNILLKTKNTKLEATNNHKVLVKISDTEAVWKRVDELRIGEKILTKVVKNIHCSKVNKGNIFY
jgi:ribonucleotide reductase alpha subunit